MTLATLLFLTLVVCTVTTTAFYDDGKSAFTAVKNKMIGYDDYDDGPTITFHQIPTNINGHFNPHTSRFVCHVPGTYVFMYTLVLALNLGYFTGPNSYYAPDLPVANLMKNREKIVNAHIRFTLTYEGGYAQAASPEGAEHYFHDAFDSGFGDSVILNLETGDEVYLTLSVFDPYPEPEGQGPSHANLINLYGTFSGFILFERNMGYPSSSTKTRSKSYHRDDYYD